MDAANSGETSAKIEIREQEKSVTPSVPESPDDKSRFLKRRNRKNAFNDYHPSHNPKSVADLPEPVDVKATEDDREEYLVVPAKDDVTEEDITRLKQELNHLPFDTVLRILSMNAYDVNATIELGLQLEVPDLVPQYVKEFYTANIAVERHANPTRGAPYKHFYFARELRKVVNTPALVDFYYNEKNKINGNWRLEKQFPPMTAEEKADLEEQMKRANITILTRDPSIPLKQTRGQKAAATRKANLLKKMANGSSTGTTTEEDPQQKGKETDSDSTSVSSLDAPSTSGLASTSAQFSSLSTPGPIRNRDVPSTSRPTNGTTGSATTSRRKKTLEEKQTGPRRSYPGRLRKPPTFFE